MKGSCPYAVTVSDDEASCPEEVLELARQSCPAFDSGKCPFKDAKSSEDVKHALLKLPPSHLDSSGHFYKALRHLHQVSQTLGASGDGDSSEYHLPGGCPVQTYYPTQSTVPYVQAMEEWSLAAIMARMASDLNEQDSEEEQEETAAVASPSSAPNETVSPSSNQVSVPKQKQPSGLAEALKTGTAASHQAAEDVHFVRNFIRGKIDRTLYGELVLSLSYIYNALEDELERHAPQHFAPCHFPKELNRCEALQEDVDYWHGEQQTRVNKMSAATQDYVDRIHHIANTDPLLLLSHAYTRYLGDLSGGRILARVARKAMNLDKNGDGLRFYQFEHVTNAKQFKDQYRRALDESSLNLTPTQISKLVGEANVAFVLNMRIFEELDVMANIPGASVRDLDEALAFANNTISNKEADSSSSKSNECPFAKINTASGAASVATRTTKTQSSSDERCPWPFVFFHDPKKGMQDWQTWAILGLILCWVWSRL